VDALSSDGESVCDVGHSTWFVEIPAHPERSWRKDLGPIDVTQLRTEGSIRLDDWMVSHPDETPVLRTTGFSEQPVLEQFIKNVVDMVLRILSFGSEFVWRRLTASAQRV
jgi:hypothetical protein